MPGVRWRLLTGAWAACLAAAVWLAWAGTRPEVDPQRWAMRPSPVVLQVAGLSGELRPRPDALELRSYEGVAPRLPPSREARVQARATVPEGAQLLVRFGAALARSGPQAPQGRGPQDPARDEGGVAVVLDGARHEVYGIGMSCSAVAPLRERAFDLGVDARDGAVVVSVDGAERARCTGSWGAGAVVLASGVRTVRVDDVRVEAGGAQVADAFGGWVRTPLACAALALLAFVAGATQGGRGGPSRGLALAGTPWLLAPLWAAVDTEGVLQALRIVALPAAAGPLVLAAPFGVGATVAWAATRGRGLALAAAFVPPLVLAGAGTAFGWRGLWGGVVLGAVSVPVAGIAWVNAHAVRFRGAWSLALVALAVYLAEVGVRLTPLQTSWVRTQGFRRAQQEFRELLELRQYRSYPMDSFPVRPPEPDPSRRRVVALGGSSTGGAFQMDDLGLFWPRKLEERIGPRGWEVVNQGVGGWNTLHVRLYVESQIERLQPDLLAVYVGHNDVLTRMAVPYRNLYAQYLAARGGTPAGAQWLASRLGGSRLYMGLTYALLGLRDHEAAVAVPVPDARENLRVVQDLAHASGARVVFMSEGLAPDPAPMAPYTQMLRGLAEDGGDLFVDTASALHEARNPDLFIDDCHLTEQGHAFVAARVEEALAANGWIEAR